MMPPQDLPLILYWNHNGKIGEGYIDEVQDRTCVPLQTLLRTLRGWRKGPINGWYFQAQSEWPQDDGFNIGSRSPAGSRVPRYYMSGSPGRIAGPPIIAEKNLMDKALDGEEESVRELYRLCDVNGNGKMSLAELDKMIVEHFPIFNYKKAIIRAMKLADRRGDRDGYINGIDEFKDFLGYLRAYTRMWNTFAAVDTDGDHRMDMEEFKQGLSLLNITHTQLELHEEFNRIDLNGGGYILFDEFCYWLAKREREATGEAAEAMASQDGLVGYKSHTGEHVGETVEDNDRLENEGN